MKRIIKTYTELSKLRTFDERFDYLKLDGLVGDATFGGMRMFNQQFYRSSEWKRIRNQIILRDNGCDLGVPGCEIGYKILIHHIVPLTIEDIRDRTPYLMDPEYLICVSNATHQALHYGDRALLMNTPIERTKFDTCPWKGK